MNELSSDVRIARTVILDFGAENNHNKKKRLTLKDDKIKLKKKTLCSSCAPNSGNNPNPMGPRFFCSDELNPRAALNFKIQ